MRKIKIIFILLLFVGVFGHSQEISKVEDSKKIDNPLSVKRISFQGLVKAPEDVLRSIVQTKIGPEIDPDQLSKDIKNLYKDTGLFSDIFVDVETAEGGGLNVIFNVKESPKIEGRINIIGNEKIKFGKIKKAITLRSGEIYNQRLSWRSEQAILQLYKEEGYYLASVKVYTDPGSEADVVSVTFEVSEWERIKIQKINLDGNEGISSEKLQKRMKTRVDKRFDEAIFEEDLSRILTFYQDSGYAQAKLVKHEKSFTEDEIGIIIGIEIDEGPQYIINEYDMKVGYSEKPAFKQEKIQSMLNPAEGEIFDRGEFEKSILGIKQLYNEEGYVLMTLNPIPSYNESEGFVDFLIEIDEGSVIVIDQIKINGLVKTKKKVIRRELDQLKIKTGEFLDMKALRKARQRLFQMGFLRNVEFVPSNTEGQRRNLNVNLDESPRTGMFSLGGGYGSEGGLFGIAEVGENNLMGQAYNIHLKGEVGTWYRRTAELRLGTPWILGSPTRANMRIYNNTSTRRYYRGLTSYSTDLTDISYQHVRYIDSRKGVSLTLGRPIFEDIDASIRFRNEDANVKHRKTTQGGGVELENYLDRFTRSLTLMLSRDTRDYRTSLYHPISGAYGTISYEYSGGFLGADNNFRK
ncbi:MAG: outer membrane protein assembly factor BamA, partial [Candidatus Poribacteria bacterium]|nr:outer membrane protein assembly factor BamA [Candidatus Poribacteria bacterium]